MFTWSCAVCPEGRHWHIQSVESRSLGPFAKANGLIRVVALSATGRPLAGVDVVVRGWELQVDTTGRDGCVEIDLYRGGPYLATVVDEPADELREIVPLIARGSFVVVTYRLVN
jgi:hypothetical protein